MDDDDVTTEPLPPHMLLQDYTTAESRFAVTVAWVTIATIGVITNTINIVVLTRYKLSSLVLYLRSLSAFDLIFCCSVIFISIFKYYRYATHPIINIQVRFLFPLNLMISAMGTYTILIISVERAFGVLYPFVAQRRLSLKVSKIMMMTMMVFVALIRLTLVYTSFEPGEISPGYYKQSATAFFRSKLGLTMWIMMGMLFEFIPFIILVISNCIVMRSVWRLKKNMSKLTSEAATMDPKVSMMLVGIVIMFLICEVPLTVTRIITIPDHIYIVVEPLTGALVFLNRSANMFIYLATSSEYRYHLRARFGCKQGQVEPWDQNNTSVTNVTQIKMKELDNN